MNKNKQFAELMGIHHHVAGDYGVCSACGAHNFINPDFTDAREVLKVMVERRDWYEFIQEIGATRRWNEELAGLEKTDLVLIDYVLDTTGKLRDRAIKWLEEKR